MKRKIKQTEFPFMMDIRHLVAQPQKKKLLVKLPKPVCTHGYSYSQLVEIMSYSELEEFKEWMNGQTCMLWKGRTIYYVDDVRRFLELRRFGKETYWD